MRPDLAPAQRNMKPDPQFGLPMATLGRALLNGVPIGLPNEYDDIFHQGMGSGDATLCDAETGAHLTERLTSTILDLATLLFQKT
jgi:creatinine amidohydrolase